MSYPIKIKVAAAILNELQACELPSWEDHNSPDVEPEALASRPLASHTYAVVERSPRTVLVINNQDEADDVFYAVCSGNFQLYHYRTACRIADALKPHAKPETVARWRYPYGG